jgi:pimeloyl-ACP methyl ester carboxylesterase
MRSCGMPSFARQGARIHYEVEGEGPRVLFIQGTGIAASGWRRQVEGLRDRFCCAVFDNRGVGGSGPADRSLSVAQMAEDAGAVLGELGWTDAHVVGHSLGGLIAQEVALRMPSRMRSLALLCTMRSGRDITRPSVATIVLGLRMYVGTRRMRRLAALGSIVSRRLDPAIDRDALAAEFADIFGRDLATQPAVSWRQIRAMAAHVPADLAPLAGIPTVVVAGDDDRIVRPALSRALADAIPGARWVELADAGHAVILQDVARINELLAEHFTAADRARPVGDPG